MTTMVRKQVYIEPRQDRLLKQWAEEMGRTEAEIVREALDQWMESEEQRRDARAAWEKEREFIETRIGEGPIAGGRTRTREALYEERLSRYDRDDD